MSKLVFRDLTAAEIELRVGMINEDGLTLLLYKDARCDMNILDETVGAENWQREHYECKGNLFCRVAINTDYDDPTAPPNWVYKSDCGTESNTEKEKGESSDSFKRACVCWSIGRELYTSPFIYIPATDKKGEPNYRTKQKNGKLTTYDNFYIEKILIEDKKITAISIKNASKDDKRVYIWQQPATM